MTGTLLQVVPLRVRTDTLEFHDHINGARPPRTQGLRRIYVTRRRGVPSTSRDLHFLTNVWEKRGHERERYAGNRLRKNSILNFANMMMPRSGVRKISKSFLRYTYHIFIKVFCGKYPRYFYGSLYVDGSNNFRTNSPTFFSIVRLLLEDKMFCFRR